MAGRDMLTAGAVREAVSQTLSPLSLYLYVCMCVYIYIHIHIHTYIYIYIVSTYTYRVCGASAPDAKTCQGDEPDHSTQGPDER